MMNALHLKSVHTTQADQALLNYDLWAVSAFVSNQKIKNAVSTVAPAKKNGVIPSPELRQKMMMEKYRTILSDILTDDFGYEPSDLYEDGIGGLVVDYMRSESRISVALCAGKLQFIYEKKCEITDKVFENLNQSQQKIIDFVRTEFAESQV